jgi:hypothetical protein
MSLTVLNLVHQQYFQCCFNAPQSEDYESTEASLDAFKESVVCWTASEFYIMAETGPKYNAILKQMMVYIGRLSALWKDLHPSCFKWEKMTSNCQNIMQHHNIRAQRIASLRFKMHLEIQEQRLPHRVYRCSLHSWIAHNAIWLEWWDTSWSPGSHFERSETNYSAYWKWIRFCTECLYSA